MTTGGTTISTRIKLKIVRLLLNSIFAKAKAAKTMETTNPSKGGGCPCCPVPQFQGPKVDTDWYRERSEGKPGVSLFDIDDLFSDLLSHAKSLISQRKPAD